MATVADPDLELREGKGGFVVLAQPACTPSVIFFFLFFTPNKGGVGVNSCFVSLFCAVITEKPLLEHTQ